MHNFLFLYVCLSNTSDLDTLSEKRRTKTENKPVHDLLSGVFVYTRIFLHEIWREKM